MPLKYNPLLSIGLEDAGNGGSSEEIAALQQAVTNLQQQATILLNAVNALKGNKITKCFVAADLANLENGEIFEWQGVDSTIDGVAFNNGYFYKVSKNDLPVGSYYYEYVSGQPTIHENGYIFAPGNYYVINNPDIDSSDFDTYRIYKYTNTQYYAVSKVSSSLSVGQTIWDEANNISLNVTAIDGSLVTLSNGATFNSGGSTGGSFTQISNCKNADGMDFTIIETGLRKIVVHYSLQNNIFTLLDFFTVPFLFLSQTSTPTSITAYTQTNTQPQYILLPATSTQLGGVIVGDGLSIADGILSGLLNIVNTDQGDIQINTNLKVVGSIAQFFVNWTDLGVETSGFTATFIDALLNYIHINFLNKQFVGLVKPNNVRSTLGYCYSQNNKFYSTMLIMGVDGSLCFLHEASSVWTLDDITKTAHSF